MRGLGFDGCTARECHTVCNKTDRVLGLTKKSASADFLVFEYWSLYIVWDLEIVICDFENAAGGS